MKAIDLVVPMALTGKLLYSKSYSPGFHQSNHHTLHRVPADSTHADLIPNVIVQQLHECKGLLIDVLQLD
jgi:hypothetical protein